MSPLGDALSVEPLLHDPLHAWIAIALGYVFLLTTSGWIVGRLVGTTGRLDEPDDEDVRRDAQYYLGGTLVNLVWGLLVALVVRGLVIGL